MWTPRWHSWPNGPFAINWDSPQAKDLAAWWPFGNEGGTFPVRDMRAKYNLAASGAPTWICDPRRGNVISFDADTEYLKISSTPVTAVPLTLCCWAYNTSLTTIAVTVEISSDGEDSAFGIGCDGVTAGDPAWAIAKTGGSVATGAAISTTGMTVNKWHHLCATFASATSRAIYIDGGSKGTSAVSRAPANLNIVFLGNDCVWGDPGSFPWPGRLSDVRIYNRVLSDTEVLALYDTRTRWDLYLPVQRFWAGLAPAAGGGVPRQMMHYKRMRQ